MGPSSLLTPTGKCAYMTFLPILRLFEAPEGSYPSNVIMNQKPPAWQSMSPHHPALNTLLSERNGLIFQPWLPSHLPLYPPSSCSDAHPQLTKYGHPPLLRTLPPRQVFHCPHLRSSPTSPLSAALVSTAKEGHSEVGAAEKMMGFQAGTGLRHRCPWCLSVYCLSRGSRTVTNGQGVSHGPALTLCSRHWQCSLHQPQSSHLGDGDDNDDNLMGCWEDPIRENPRTLPKG